MRTRTTLLDKVKRLIRIANIIGNLLLFAVGAYCGAILGVNAARWFEPAIVQVQDRPTPAISE